MSRARLLGSTSKAALSFISVFSSYLLASCVSPGEPPRLRPRIRVEVEGSLDAGNVAAEIDETELEEGVEAGGALERGEREGEWKMRGVVLDIPDHAEFEDADKNPIAPEPLREGQWVKVKGRFLDGKLRVRKVRLEEQRDRWEVEGVVTEVEEQDGRTILFIPPFRVIREERTDVTLFDPNKEWDDFLNQGPLSRRATKNEKFVPFSIRLGDRVRGGGQLSTQWEHKDNLDLNDSRRRDEDDFTTSLEVDLIARIGEEGFFLAELEGKYDSERKEERASTRDTNLAPHEVYFFLPDVLFQGLHVQVGRQDLDERREWLYDERLDALRLYYDLDPVTLEASVSATPEILAVEDEETIINFVGVAALKVAEDWVASAYVLDRNSREHDEFSPTLIGLRSFDKSDGGLGHWAELSYSTGTIDDRKFHGFGVDFGGTWVAPVPLEPSFTLGYAFGEGDDDPTGTSHTYRQSGLNDNNDKWNGVSSFRYYGEVLEPELSNLEIFTAGVGARPSEQSSIDLVFHHYRQAIGAAGTLFGEINAPLTGVDPDLGFEFDVILGYRIRHLTLEMVAGWFEPGPAFVDDDPAWLWAFTARFKF